MKPKLLILFTIIVLLPLGLLLWLGLRLVDYEQQNTRQKFQELLLAQLVDVDETIGRLIEQRETNIINTTQSLELSSLSLRQSARRNPVIRQFFVLTGNGRLRFPDPQGQLSDNEWAFLQRTRDILTEGNLVRRDPADVPQQRMRQAIQQQSPTLVRNRGQAYVQQAESVYTQALSTAPTSQGWRHWYHGNGDNLIFWQKTADRSIVGAELDPVRLLADVIAILPQTDPVEDIPLTGRTVLADSMNRPLYQWGRYEPSSEEQAPLTQLGLSHPLSGWSLKAYLPPKQIQSGVFSGTINVVGGFVVLCLAVIGLATYFYRESTREIRDADQRVTFVNQVSHELKTPLTNIRLYAELLQQNPSATEEKEKKHLDIIVNESQRLSRLIGNILNFGRQQHSQLTIHPIRGIIDESIRTILDHFNEAFKTNGIDITFRGHAPADVRFDHDALEQILGNLINNIEKYAAEGGAMTIVSRQTNDETRITVRDNGSGIPTAHREKIFEPFHRISNKLTDGVAGAGIGLALARDLARLHGGDLILLETRKGAAFELKIETSPARAVQEPPLQGT